MRLIGHRGAAAVAPENTAEGVRRAFADGADAAEIDVRLSADGLLVVVHDGSLPDGGGGGVSVKSLTAAELAARGIPRLDEVWEAAEGRLVVELKAEWGGDLASRCAEALERFLTGRRTDDLVVSSFDLLALQTFAARVPVTTGLLTLVGVDAPSAIAAACQGGHQIVFLPREVSDAAAIEEAHNRGLLAIPWTVNDADELRGMRDAGADGVITDDPASAVRALRPTL